MGMILRFIDKDTLEMRSVVLACKLWDESHDAAGTAEMVKKVLADWSIDEADIDWACTDNAAVMIASIRDYFPRWQRLACAPHTLDLPMSDMLAGAYKEMPVATAQGGTRSTTKVLQWAGKGPEVVTKLFKRVRVVVNYHTNRANSKLYALIYNKAVESGEEEGERARCFIKPGETRWTGLFLMGRGLERNRAYTVKFQRDHPGETDCALSAEDHVLLGQVLAVLEPFKEAMDVFQTTDSVAISQIYPTLLHLHGSLIKADGEIESEGKTLNVEDLMEPVQQLRKALAEGIHDRFFNLATGRAGATGVVYKHFEVYGSATYLDPRNIKLQLLFFDQKAPDGRSLMEYVAYAATAFAARSTARIIEFLQREVVRKPTAVWIGRVAPTAGSLVGGAGGAEQGGAGEPPTKRPKTDWKAAQAAKLLERYKGAGAGTGTGAGAGGSGSSGSGGSGGGMVVVTAAMVKELVERELAEYRAMWSQDFFQKNPWVLEFDACPLKGFWAQRRESMPVLCFLAHLVMSLVPSAADTERLFSKSGFTMSERRTCLDPQRMDDMMIVQGNWDDVFLEFTEEEKEEKKAKREAHSKAISVAKKAAHAAKKAAPKKQTKRESFGLGVFG